MSLGSTLIAELEREARTTRILLERVPDEKLGWKPHEKSMTLGQLAQHVATIPGGIATIGSLDSYDITNFTKPPEPESSAELVATLDENVAKAKSILGGMDDAALMQSWSLTKAGEPVMILPRVGLFRTILLNHLYHHRGQLTVYLRLLDVPIPSIYGPSADENPFA
jgi:uncharacterized damage-inducible protein DinB